MIKKLITVHSRIQWYLGNVLICAQNPHHLHIIAWGIHFSPLDLSSTMNTICKVPVLVLVWMSKFCFLHNRSPNSWNYIAVSPCYLPKLPHEYKYPSNRCGKIWHLFQPFKSQECLLEFRFLGFIHISPLNTYVFLYGGACSRTIWWRRMSGSPTRATFYMHMWRVRGENSSQKGWYGLERGREGEKQMFVSHVLWVFSQWEGGIGGGGSSTGSQYSMASYLNSQDVGILRVWRNLRIKLLGIGMLNYKWLRK